LRGGAENPISFGESKKKRKETVGYFSSGGAKKYIHISVRQRIKEGKV